MFEEFSSFENHQKQRDKSEVKDVLDLQKGEIWVETLEDIPRSNTKIELMIFFLGSNEHFHTVILNIMAVFPSRHHSIVVCVCESVYIEFTRYFTMKYLCCI